MYLKESINILLEELKNLQRNHRSNKNFCNCVYVRLICFPLKIVDCVFGKWKAYNQLKILV